MTVITGKVSIMTKMTLEVDHDQLTDWMVKELKQCYIDHATHWRHEPDHEYLSNALLTVIGHYSVYTEFEKWYETIKEL